MSPHTGSRRHATMRDVAALAGVGLKTVSRVVNDEPNVSPETKERVERAIDALGFEPNHGAGSLRREGGRTQTIGLILDAVDNPFSAAINRAVETVAAARGTAVFAASSDDDTNRERELVAAFNRRRVDGLIITAYGPDQGYLQSVRERGTPLVFVDRVPRGLLADVALTDNVGWAAVATEHLIDHGHRRIAFLCDDVTIPTARDRRHGYERAMTSAGLEVPDGYTVGDLTTADLAAAAVERLLERPDPPTALITAQNLITIGGVRSLHRLGRQSEIALVGFDDLPLAELLTPGITVVAQDPAAIGRVAAERLFARMDDDSGPAETITVPARLITRGSGELQAPELAPIGRGSPAPAS
ncbi:MAG TPA: LacI family DNA-binding transcriptional regulator [Microlunatus sp.]|nr:LacI family DNA-binding transcriptional regulator [Microlunatus sp.]